MRPQVSRALHVVHAVAMREAWGAPFTRVVGVDAANDDDDIALLSNFDRSALALFCGLADSIGEPNFRVREPFLEKRDEAAHARDGLSGLGGHAKARPFAERRHVVIIENDVK